MLEHHTWCPLNKLLCFRFRSGTPNLTDLLQPVEVYIYVPPSQPPPISPLTSRWYGFTTAEACGRSLAQTSCEQTSGKGQQRPRYLGAYDYWLNIPDFQFRHGCIPVKWRHGSHLLCGLLLRGPCVTLLLSAFIREYTSRVVTPWTPQDGSVASHHDAHCCLLIQGGGNHAIPGTGARMEHGWCDGSWRLLRLLPAPGGNKSIRGISPVYFSFLVKRK